MVDTESTNRAESRSPKQTQQSQGDSNKTKKANAANAEPGKPLAPPPKPGSSDDYFGSLNLEPNPFEHSFGGGASNGGTSAAETPGGTKLPSVAALTSPRFAETPSSLLPGTGTTPFNWGGGSLRTGPLSPAMLSAPQTDYFGDSHLRGGFPTPNESSMRTGLTPGGSGSMFPAASPNSQALFNQLASGVATPNTMDFHRTAMNAAAAKAREQGQNSSNQQQQLPTSNPQEMPNGVTVKQETKATSGPFDPHDNDAANGLFMLAQGRNGAAPANTYAMASQQPVHAHPAPTQQTANTSPHMTNGNGPAANARATRGASEAASAGSGESEQTRPATRGKGKRNSATGSANGRRKAEDTPAKPPASKKAKTAAASIPDDEPDYMSSDDDDKNMEDGSGKSKMTDEEKRKNFLERNRVAALKCRQRKKQWLANLQNKVELFSTENDALTAQISQLREEVVNLKTLLLAHKDCPVTQQQGLHGAFMQQAMDTYNPQMNPYGMGAPIQNQPVMAGQGVQRRFS